MVNEIVHAIRRVREILAEKDSFNRPGQSPFETEEVKQVSESKLHAAVTLKNHPIVKKVEEEMDSRGNGIVSITTHAWSFPEGFLSKHPDRVFHNSQYELAVPHDIQEKDRKLKEFLNQQGQKSSVSQGFFSHYDVYHQAKKIGALAFLSQGKDNFSFITLKTEHAEAFAQMLFPENPTALERIAYSLKRKFLSA